MQSLVERARSALAGGDHGRAAVLAQEALHREGNTAAAWRLTADALTGVLREAGLLGAGVGAGTVSPRVLREGSAGEAVAEVAGDLQRALYALAGAGDVRAAREIYDLGASLCDLDLTRAERSGAPTGRVVSILCCERPELLERTVRDLLASDLPPSDIVFFDDASTDPRVRELLADGRFAPHRTHVLTNRGFRTRSPGGNQNAVLDYAERFLGGFDTFIIVDSDMALAPDWWSAQQEIVRRLTGRELPEGKLGAVTAFHAARSHPAVRTVDVDGLPVRIKRTTGGCLLAVSREVYETVLGPFDHLADWGWCARLRVARRFIAATVPSRAQHLGRESLLFHQVCDAAQDFEP